VSSEIHINGRCVSEPVREEKGKTMAPEPEDRRDLKRARVVLSKGHEVVGPGYSRVIDVVVKVMNKRENLGNHGWVNRVSKMGQHYPRRVNRVSQNSNTDQQANRVSWVGNTVQKKGGSSHVANTDVWVTENSANTESWITENSANTKKPGYGKFGQHGKPGYGKFG
jgi:hypothetical protein